MDNEQVVKTRLKTVTDTLNGLLRTLTPVVQGILRADVKLPGVQHTEKSISMLCTAEGLVRVAEMLLSCHIDQATEQKLDSLLLVLLRETTKWIEKDEARRTFTP